MATLRRSPYTVINIWCPYGNIAKIALYRYIYLMSICCLIPSYGNIAKIVLYRHKFWCPYVNIAKIALYRYKYLMSIWQHCEDRLIPL